MQAPALVGACQQCEQKGVKHDGLATTYAGAHAFLAEDDPLRQRWADEHSKHESGRARTALRDRLQSADAPTARTDASIRAAGLAVRNGEMSANEAGYHNLSVLADALPYFNMRKCIVNDSMHIYANASMCSA